MNCIRTECDSRYMNRNWSVWDVKTYWKRSCWSYKPTGWAVRTNWLSVPCLYGGKLVRRVFWARGKRIRWLPYSLGKVRVRKRASNWLENSLFIYSRREVPWHMWTVSDIAREKNPLSPCFLETNNKPKECFKGHFETQKIRAELVVTKVKASIIYGASLGLLFVRVRVVWRLATFLNEGWRMVCVTRHNKRWVRFLFLINVT
jgi:hypothetical protein